MTGTQWTEKNTFGQFGTFSTPSFAGLGEPYDDKRKADSRTTGRQFLTNCGKKGQTGDNWNRGNNGRKIEWGMLYEGEHGASSKKLEGEKFADPHIPEQKWKAAERKKNLTQDGFRYSNPNAKSSGLGGYWGIIEPKESSRRQHLPEYNVLTKDMKPGPCINEERQILTNPAKRGMGMTPGIIFGAPGGKSRGEYEHSVDPLSAQMEAAVAERKRHDEACSGRPAFKSMSRNLDFFDQMGKVASSRVYTEEPRCPERPEPEKAREAVGKAFYPAHGPVSGDAGLFQKFKEIGYMEDPLDEKIRKTREAVAAAKGDGKPFRPTSRPKSTRTQSILFHHAGVSL